jgi:hypothetical protein
MMDGWLIRHLKVTGKWIIGPNFCRCPNSVPVRTGISTVAIVAIKKVRTVDSSIVLKLHIHNDIANHHR